MSTNGSPSPTERPASLFRPDLLSLRRRMLGLSQAELAARSELPQATVSRLEQGLREPTTEFIDRLSAALVCQTSFFYQSTREYGAPLSAHPMFRKHTLVGQRVIDQVIASLNVRLAHLRTMFAGVDFKEELPLPAYDIEDFGGDAAEVAAQVRRAWYMPSGPVKSLTEYAERAGCIVVHCEMEEAKIDGVSYRVPDLPPVIFLNMKAASRGLSPFSTQRSMFSTTTMASSTTIPIASTRPKSERIFIEKPAMYMAAKVPMRETGMATSGTMEVRQFWRNTSTTRATRATPSRRVRMTSRILSRTKRLVSYGIS